MPVKYKLPQETINWIITIGYKQHTITELCRITGNVVSFSAIWGLLRKHGLNPTTVYNRAEAVILQMHAEKKLKSIMEAEKLTGFCQRLISKIVHKHKLPLRSKRARSVVKNRWHKAPYKITRKKRKPRINSIDYKKQAVQAMLNKQRPKW